MDSELNEIEGMVQRTAYQFATKELAPRAAETDDDPGFAAKSAELLARHGYLGIMIPEEYDGQGMTGFDYILAKEQIARACLSTAATLGAHNLAVYCL